MPDVEQRQLEVRNAHGLHARPAALFVQMAAKFKSTIILRNLSRGGREVNAKSIMEVLTAGVDQGAHIELVAEGEDAAEAVDALTQLVQSGLGDQ
jgi:phosphotransferase system HPr (HPr) family protein